MSNKNSYLPLSLAAMLAVMLSASIGCSVDRGPVRSRPAYDPPARISVDVGFFYDSLAPFGEWIFDVDFGWVWTPYGVASGWRPYTEGRWVYTDYGWTWVSIWEWGWAPFHYGRWHFRDRHGWVWIPGREWAPAWVAWRYGDGWIGWAPLPPAARFRAGVGLEWGSGGSPETTIRIQAWSFVESHRILESRIRARVVAESRNASLIRSTRDTTRYETNKERIVARGVDVDEVARITERAVPRYTVRSSPLPDRGPATRVRSGEVRVARPKVQEAAPDRTPPGRKKPATAKETPKTSRNKKSDRR